MFFETKKKDKCDTFYETEGVTRTSPTTKKMDY